MASSSQFLLSSSSSPTPHQLHSFRRFAPQPSPLAHTTTLFRRRPTIGFEPSLELDEEACLDYDDDEEEADVQRDNVLNEEEDVQSEVDEQEEEELIDDDEDDDLAEQHQQGATSPSLDISFASSMSIGTAPPTPSLHNRRQTVTSQRLVASGHPTPPTQRNHANRSTTCPQSTFLPAHLFAPNPEAQPPSSSPYRMDISPPPPHHQLSPQQAHSANFFNPPKPSTSHHPFDPFSSLQNHVQSSSPPTTDRPTIGLKKRASRQRVMVHDFFEPRAEATQFATSDEESDKMCSDGMDIDSPGYAQRTRSLFQPLVVLGDSSVPLHRPSRAGRSGSQGSIGKRSRSDEDDYEESVEGGSSLGGSDMRSVQMQHPRSRSDDGSIGRHSLLSPSSSHSASGRSRTMPETLLVAEDQEDRSRAPLLPSSPLPAVSGRRFGQQLETNTLSSSPSHMMSPSVKAAAKLTLGRKAGERSLSGFRFPVSKASTGAQIAHTRAGSTSASMNPRLHQTYQPGTGGSLGASSTGSGLPRRPALGVVQSAATLFSRHHHSSLASVPMISSSESEVQGLRQRDSVGRPASKSRRAISFAATEGHLLMSGAGDDDDDDDDDEDGHLGLNCSPAPRGTTHTWPKYGVQSFAHSRMASESSRVGNPAEPRKRSPPPPPLDSLGLAPPTSGRPGGMFENMLQSPNRLSPHQQRMKIGMSTRIIESPVGMGFSEKERAGKILPCHKVSNDGLMRISPATMDDFLQGKYDGSILRKIVIDCRFKYEYEGGHIKQAINLREKEMVEDMLLGGKLFDGQWTVPEPSESGKCDGNGVSKKVVLVFHCEYSAMRAPTIAKYLREKDRHLNMPHYPALHYPEVYILEGGYAKYHAHSPQHCDGIYVPMDDPSYRNDRHLDLNQFRNNKESNNRSKSFNSDSSSSSSSQHLLVKKKISKKIMRDENIMEEEDESPCKLEKRRSNQCLKNVGADHHLVGGGSLGRAGGVLMARKLETNQQMLGGGGRNLTRR